jgi:hypothetical protein
MGCQSEGGTVEARSPGNGYSSRVASCVTKGPGGSTPPRRPMRRPRAGSFRRNRPYPRGSRLAEGATLFRGRPDDPVHDQDWTPDLLYLLARKTYDADDPRPVMSTIYTYDKGLLVQR